MRKNKLIVLYSLLLLFLLNASCFAIVDMKDELDEFIEDRYLYDYPKDFFLTGGEPVRFNSAVHLKIGVIVRNQSKLLINEIIAEIFSTAPFDRYRSFFVFLREDDIQRAKRNRSFYVPAYDSYGRSLPGGFNIAQSSVRAGLIVLDASNYEFKKTGTLGFSRNNTATAQKLTILHEFGHAIAGLGDEYSINRGVRDIEKQKAYSAIGVSYEYLHSKIWTKEYPNLDYRSHKILKWRNLIKQGFIEDKRIKRIELNNGYDEGRFFIPCERCIMNRLVDSKIEFCPVCQLQIIESISYLTGAIPPWYKEDE